MSDQIYTFGISEYTPLREIMKCSIDITSINLGQNGDKQSQVSADNLTIWTD